MEPRNLVSKTVLYVIDDLDVGGTEQQLLYLIEGMDRTRYRPVVCVFRKLGRIAANISRLGVSVISVPKRSRYDWSVVFALRRIIRRERVDVVHTLLWTANTWGRVAAILERVPIVIAAERNVDSWKRWYHHGIDRWLARRTTAVLANAAAVRDFVVEVQGVPGGKVSIILNGIDIGKFPKSPRETQRQDLVTVGFLGRLEPQKGLELVLAVAEHFRDGASHVKFVIGGTGSLEAWLNEQVDSRSLGSLIAIVGEVNDSQGFLRGLDAFILMSHREGLPNVLLEAGLSELACIATAVGGNPEVVVNGTTGILVPPGDVEAAAGAVRRLVGDAPLRLRMGQAARQRIITRFAVGRMVADTLYWYG